MSNNNSEEEDIEMPDMTVCNPSDILLDPIISGSFYNNLVSLPSKECPYTSSFEIKVPILVVFNKIIFVADTVTGLVAEFRDEVHANMRLLLGANKLFRESSTVPVAYGTAKHIDFKKNKGVLHYHCSQCLAKHSTKIRVTIPLQPFIDKSNIIILSVDTSNYKCYSHGKSHKIELNDINQKNILINNAPRQAQFHFLSQTDNLDDAPSHQECKNKRMQLLRFEKYHDDLFQSLRIATEKSATEARFLDLEPIQRGEYHYLTTEPQFSVAIYNARTAAITNKAASFTDPPLTMDSTEGACANYLEPFTNISYPIIMTALCVGSTAKKETLITALFVSRHRELAIFARQFNGFVDLCKYLNGGSDPAWHRMITDMYPFWHPVCLRINKISEKHYKYIGWSLIERNGRNRELLPILLFIHCRIHYMAGIDRFIDFSTSNEVRNWNKDKRELFRSILKKFANYIRIPREYKYLITFINYVLIVLNMKYFKLFDTNHALIHKFDWRDVVGWTPPEGDDKSIYDEIIRDSDFDFFFQFDKESNSFVAKIFGIPLVVLQNKETSVCMNVINIMSITKCVANTNNSVVINPFYSPAMVHYIRDIKMPEFPLWSQLVFGNTLIETDQRSEGAFMLLKNYNHPSIDISLNVYSSMHNMRLDIWLLHFIDLQPVKIARFLKQLKVDMDNICKAAVASLKDNVSKKGLTMWEKRLHQIFDDFLIYYLDYNRNKILNDWNKYWNEKQTNQKNTVQLNLNQITLLKNHRSLPKGPSWRDECYEWLHERLKSVKVKIQDEMKENE